MISQVIMVKLQVVVEVALIQGDLSSRDRVWVALQRQLLTPKGSQLMVVVLDLSTLQQM